MQEVSENIFVATYFRGPTVAAILSEEGYILVDAPPFPEDARRWKTLLQSKSNKPFRALILTDSNPERLLGAFHFQPDVIVAHRGTYEYIKSLPTSYNNSIASMLTRIPYEQAELNMGKILLPTVTFDESVKVHFADVTLHLSHHPGPTKSSLLIEYPAQRILFSGDIVVVGTAPYLSGSFSMQWLETLAKISSEDFAADIIIPGHGNITVKTAIEPVMQFLETAQERMRILLENGQSLSETARLVHELLNFFPPPLESELNAVQQRVRVALQSIYAELRQSFTDHDLMM